MGRPLLVDVVASALSGNSRRKKDPVGCGTKRLHKTSRLSGRKVFRYFERDGQIEAARQGQRLPEIVHGELITGDCQVGVQNPGTVNTPNIADTELDGGSQPVSRATTNIDDARGL